MTMTTYLQPGEYLQPTSHAGLNALLRELIRETGADWRLCEVSRPTRRFFGLREGKPEFLYGLFVHLSGGEFQCINFDLDSEWSINNRVSAVVMLNYIYGYLAGIHRAKMGLLSSGAAGLISPNSTLQVMLGYMTQNNKGHISCSVPS